VGASPNEEKNKPFSPFQSLQPNEKKQTLNNFLTSFLHPQLDKRSLDVQASEVKRTEMQVYVTKLERKLASTSAKRGVLTTRNATPSKKVERESLLDAIAELQGENVRLHQALEEVEEALDVEAKRLDLADGGALLESLRTRRLLETAELTLKVRKGPK
jgi:hypothetical protein